ncbi:MAG: hypothetical protein M3487_08470 [Actinomycetota bacterium]|nr:hypothetical protein [Actinomycetota bacterium]
MTTKIIASRDAPGTVIDGEQWTAVEARGHRYERLVVRTRWLEPADDLVASAHEAVAGMVRSGDTVFVSEKLVILLTGRTVPADAVHPGRLARMLVGFVKPRPGSRGLSVPEKMQYVIDRTGRPRVVVAAAASAITRPFGWHGVFYRVAGSLARDLDGGRPPYEHLLFPPLDRVDARVIANILEEAMGTGVAIVDLNDFGGSVRATSERALPARELLSALGDNPLGQRAAGTPFGILRPVAGDVTPVP